MHELYEVKEKLIDEIGEYASKGKLSRDDAMNIKYLSSGADHICNIIEACEEEYSGDYSGDGISQRRSYRNGRSYARRRNGGRRSYSDGYGGGYSGDMDDQTRKDIHKLVEKLEGM